MVQREVADILNNLKEIDPSEKKLTAGINSWDGVISDTINMENDVPSANAASNTDNTEEQSPFDSGDCNTVVSYFRTTVEPDIQQTLHVLVEKRPVYKQLGLDVITDMEKLKNEYGKLCYSIAAACETLMRDCEKVDARFDKAIKASS